MTRNENEILLWNADYSPPINWYGHLAIQHQQSHVQKSPLPETKATVLPFRNNPTKNNKHQYTLSLVFTCPFSRNPTVLPLNYCKFSIKHQYLTQDTNNRTRHHGSFMAALVINTLDVTDIYGILVKEAK